MDKLLSAASSVAGQIFAEFTRRGGIVRDGDRILSVADMSSFQGGLTPILWMLREFIVDYEIDFPRPVYVADPSAMLGVSIVELEISRSASPSVFMLADFLRNELLQETTNDLDLSLLFANFKEWAATNVSGYRSPSALFSAQRPE